MAKLNKIKGNTYYIDMFTNIGVFVKNNNVTLIDCGFDGESAVNLDNILLGNNLHLTNIIITHAHADHMGGCKYFQDKYKCNVLSTIADTAIANLSIMNTSLIYGGLPTSIARGKMLYAPSCNATLLTHKNTPDGLEIVDLRGHSIDMIGVKTEDNVLFVADALISEKTINKFPLTYVLDLQQYYNSLQKIETSNCEYFVPSHAEVTSDIKPLIELNKKQVKQNIIDILSVLDKPLEVSDIVANYCEKFNYSMKTSQFFVATTTVKNYLAYLEKIGQLQTYVKNNRLYFEKID